MRRHATRGTARRRCNCRWTPATGDPAPQAVASTPFHPSGQPLCAPVADTRHSARRPPTPEGQKSAAPRPDHPRQTLTKPALSLPVHYRFPHLERESTVPARLPPATTRRRPAATLGHSSSSAGNVLRNAALPGRPPPRRQLGPSRPDAGPRQARYSSRGQRARQERLRQTLGSGWKAPHNH